MSASVWCRLRTWKCSSARTGCRLIHRVSLSFPAVEQRALADQIRRASKSICANLAEGYGRQKGSKAEFVRFIRMAIGSSDEMRVWLRYAFDLGYIDEPSGKAGATNIS